MRAQQWGARPSDLCECPNQAKPIFFSLSILTLADVLVCRYHRDVDIHPAARHFQAAAGTYQQARPSYPAAAIRLLVEALDIGPGRRVVDIGAGTGKFTRLLVDAGADVIAVEPVPAMREQFAAVLPNTEILAGTAEQLPLPDTSADVVVAAQAWHWFDAPAALSECARILRRHGGLGLVWNDYDQTVPWVRQFAAVYRRRASADEPRHSDHAWQHAFEGLAGWTPLEQARVPNQHHTTRTGVINRMLSSSWIAGLPTAGQAEVIGEVEAILDADPATAGRIEIDIPYVTEIYWCKRR